MPNQGRPKKTTQKVQTSQTYLDKVSREIESNQSRLSMVLGALILLVVGILIFNYFNKNNASLGPAQQTQTDETQDVSPDKLPGKYTVKDEDTLFVIAEKYYQDGSKFEDIAKANNLDDVNSIVTGQVLEIPKLEGQQEEVLPSPSPSETPTPTTVSEPESPTTLIPTNPNQFGTGGGSNTVWGPKIEGDSYTVLEGDWLSTIAARAYGDVFAYKKLADANKISNPDYILPGMILTIPR